MLIQFTELLDQYQALVNDLQKMYAGRPYHNWDHVLAILLLGSRYPHLIKDIEAFFWMAIFHDAIYQSTRQDNEEKSASFARECLKEIVSSIRLELICAGIVSTAKHAVPTNSSPTATQDIAFFLDCDLAILGSNQETFQAYDLAIRKEYDWVSDDQWRIGRAGVMNKFMTRNPLYFTKEMQIQFEANARKNMQKLIKDLSS